MTSTRQIIVDVGEAPVRPILLASSPTDELDALLVYVAVEIHFISDQQFHDFPRTSIRL